MWGKDANTQESAKPVHNCSRCVDICLQSSDDADICHHILSNVNKVFIFKISSVGIQVP